MTSPDTTSPIHAPVPGPLRPRAIPWVFLVLGCGMAVFVWQAHVASVKTANETAFQSEISETCRGIQTRVDAYTSVLLGLRGLFEASEHVSASEFSAYFNSLELADRYPGFRMISHIRAAPRSEIPRLLPFIREALQFHMEDAGKPEIFPPSDRPMVYPIVYAEPCQFLSTLGYDYGSEATCLQALERARDTGRLTASGRIHVITDLPDSTHSFALLMPIYRHGGVPDTVEERREKLTGFATAVFSLAGFKSDIESNPILKGTRLKIHDYGYEKTTDESPLLIYDSLPPDRAAQAGSSPPKHSAQRMVRMGDREWSLEFHTLDGAQFAEKGLPSWIFLFGGLTVSFLIFAVAQGIVHSRSQALELARLARRELELTSENLRQTGRLAAELTENRHQLGLATAGARLVFWQADPDCLHFPEPRAAFWNDFVGPASITRDAFTNLIHPEDRKLFANTWTRMVESSAGENFQLEFRIQPVSGTTLWMEMKGRRSGPGKWGGVLMDITERKRFEDDRIHASKLESIGLLAGGIAHDMNNILTAIHGNLQLSELKLPPGHESGRLINEALKACARAAELSRQLLTFSKGGDPVKTVVDAAALIRETVHFSTRGSNTRPILDLDPDLERIKADRSQFLQVVNNLVINAVQAMPKGGILSITGKNIQVGHMEAVRTGLEPGPHILLRFADTGHGIPPENLAKIFDPYFTTKEQGSGLGLSTVYSIIKRHGGIIRVESEPGRGTQFEIYLPSCQEAPEPATPAPPSPPPAPRGLRVLSMDDEPIIRSLMEHILGMLDCTVTTVTCGEEAVAAFENARRDGHPYDVVLLDLTIVGGLGGKETMARLRELDPSVVGFAVSGYSSDPIMSNHAAYGFTGVLPKPFSIQDLHALLGHLAEKAGRHLAALPGGLGPVRSPGG